MSLPEINESKPLKGEQNIETRLFHVYDFAGDIIRSHIGEGLVDLHLDVGTYNGFALPRLVKIAQEVHSIDIDPQKLAKAGARPEVNALMNNGNVMLYEMDAKDIRFEENSFDSATIIEVFGAGFEGTSEDVARVFEGVHRVLRPGGVLVFTIKSRTIQELLQEVGTFDAKGVALPRKVLNPILRPLFGEPQWYGQRILRKTADGVVLPYDLSNLSYVPRPVDPQTEVPLFWVGVCQKPI
jgi:SAM-dependent methyltransferase